MANFWPKITLLTRFSIPLLLKYVIFTSISFFLLWFRCFSATLFCSFSLCDIVCFLVSFRYLFDSDCQINFDQVHIKSMTLESSTLQIWRHGYSGDLNIVICIGFSTLSFYAINMDAVNLFTDSSFLFLVNFHCIDVLYQFKWMNIIYFCLYIYIHINFNHWLIN